MKAEVIKFIITMIISFLVLLIWVLLWYDGTDFNRYILVFLLVFTIWERIEVTNK